MTCGDSLPGQRLNTLVVRAGLEPLSPELVQKFEDYLSLFIRWNARINLSAIRDEEGILSRHFVESIACARALPTGISTLLDFGSGGGLPGIPIALCRPEIRVTLGESQGKKAAFLREAIRVLGIPAEVYGGRAEMLQTSFDCAAMRAVDRMEAAVRAASRLVGPGGWLALLTTGHDLMSLQRAAGAEFDWLAMRAFPGSDDRLLALGRLISS